MHLASIDCKTYDYPSYFCIHPPLLSLVQINNEAKTYFNEIESKIYFACKN